MKFDPLQPGSICLFRLSALGDVCNCVPLVRALQRRWPEVRITWIIGRIEHRLVAALPEVEFIVLDKRAGWRAVRVLRQALAGRRFDVLLQAQVSARANLLSLLIGAQRRVGFDQARSREGHGLVVSERIAAVPFQHQALAFLEFARHLGADIEHIDRRLPIDESSQDFARRHQPKTRHAVLISPSSSHVKRNWTVTGYATVADWVIEQTGRPVIFIGGPTPAEKALANAIEQTMQQQAINLVGKDTLPQALAMIERSACLISPDAGPAHFAAALGIPVVGLYAATWSRRSGPLGSLDHCVDCFPQAARQFLGCEPEKVRWGRRIERPGVMALITPEMVIEKLKPLLANEP